VSHEVQQEMSRYTAKKKKKKKKTRKEKEKEQKKQVAKFKLRFSRLALSSSFPIARDQPQFEPRSNRFFYKLDDLVGDLVMNLNRELALFIGRSKQHGHFD
jgi:hypothetical protein